MHSVALIFSLDLCFLFLMQIPIDFDGMRCSMFNAIRIDIFSPFIGKIINEISDQFTKSFISRHFKNRFDCKNIFEMQSKVMFSAK